MCEARKARFGFAVDGFQKSTIKKEDGMRKMPDDM